MPRSSPCRWTFRDWYIWSVSAAFSNSSRGLATADGSWMVEVELILCKVRERSRWCVKICLWKSGHWYFKLASDCLSDAIQYFITMFKSQPSENTKQEFGGYGRKETQPLKPSVKQRDQQNTKCFVAFWKLIAAHFYQINAVVAETTQIADTFVAFCLT